MAYQGTHCAVARKRRSHLGLGIAFMVVAIFFATYFWFSNDAVAMEKNRISAEDLPVGCTVEYANPKEAAKAEKRAKRELKKAAKAQLALEEKLAEQLENQPESQPENALELEYEPEIEVEQQQVDVMPMPTMMRVATNTDPSMMANGITSSDLADYITNYVIYVPEDDGSLSSETEFRDGNTVRVHITYEVDGDDDCSHILTYQIADEVLPDVDQSGVVKNGDGDVVGQYDISQNGQIVIIFNEDFNTSITFKGGLTFDATMKADQEHVQDKIVLGEVDNEFEYVVETGDTPDTNKTDLFARKGQPTKIDENTYEYTVVVGSLHGTGEETVNIEDTFDAYGAGKQNADYSNIVITHTNAGNTETEITDPQPTITNNGANGDSKFSIADLPALQAGETYTVTYTATLATTQADSSGNSELVNNLHAYSDRIHERKQVTTKLKASIITKTGTYDKETEIGSWEITLDANGQNLSDYTLKDTITANDGTEIALDSATLYDADGNEIRTGIDLPCKLSDLNLNWEESYTIAYTANLSGLSNNVNVTVGNKVEIVDDNDNAIYNDQVNLPSIYKNIYDAEKESTGVDGTTVHWTTTIHVAENEEITQDLTYTDTVDTQMRGQGHTPYDTHYATLGALHDLVVQAGETALTQPDDYTMRYKDWAHNWYDLPTGDYNPDDKVRDFEIVLKAACLTDCSGQDIQIVYDTFVDADVAIPGMTYEVTNKAEVGGIDLVATGEYTKNESIDKMSWDGESYQESSGKPDYTKPLYDSTDKEITYKMLLDDDGNAYIKYRLKFLADAHDLNDLENLIITDTLPENTELVTDSIKIYWGGPYDTQAELGCNKNNKWYQASNYLSCTEQGGELTIQMLPRYKADYDELQALQLSYIIPSKFFIDYTLKLPSTTAWDDTTDIPFTNKLTCGEEEKENTVIVTSDQQYIVKRGTRLVDENQQQQDGMQYTLEINRKGKDLNSAGNRIAVTDALTVKNRSHMTAELDLANVKVYLYDENADDHLGAPISMDDFDVEQSEEQTDNATIYKFTLHVPDNKHLMVSYAYHFTPESVQYAGATVPLSNKAIVLGVEDYEDVSEDEEKFSSAYVSQEVLTLYKYDESNKAHALPGATFHFEKYQQTNDGDYDWVETPFGSKTTGSDGEIRLALEDTNREVGVLYRFEETQSPEGYQTDQRYYYFIFVEDAYKENTLDYIAHHVEMPQDHGDETVYAKDVIFVVNDQTVLPISNRKSGLDVEKQWQDDNGNTITPPENVDSIQVTLYQHASQSVGTHTLNVASWKDVYDANDPNKVEGVIRKELTVADGSPVMIAVFNSADTKQFFKIMDADKNFIESHPGTASSRFPNIKFLEIDSVTQDLNITITNSSHNETYDFYFFNFEQGVYEPLEEKTEIGTYTISAEEDWHKHWNLVANPTTEGELAAFDEAGNPYFYSVEEINPPSGFRPIYAGTDGQTTLHTGKLEVINRALPFALPSTGAPPKLPHRVIGLLSIVGIAMLCIRKRQVYTNKNRRTYK